jgi:hypothetical protein
MIKGAHVLEMNGAKKEDPTTERKDGRERTADAVLIAEAG